MKRFFLISSLIISSLIHIQAQQQLEPWQYGHWLSAEEAARKNWNNRSFVETDPPVAPVRNVAEFDKMQGALIRYPFGIPISLIKEMAKDIMVTTIVASTSQQNTVLQQYVNNGVDTSHCNFLIAPTDSYWTRDYGPWFESDSANHIGIIDFPYNRPRPNDDEIPKKVAEMLGIPWYGMNIKHTGGNYMTDGMGISSSTDLVWVENPTQSHAGIAQKMHDYLGIENYQVVPDPNISSTIDHIDCWGKFLAPDKILIRRASQTSSDYTALENMASYWSQQICSYGYYYKVYRVNTPQSQPYSNSLILNNKVMIPFMNSAWDDSAKTVYEEAMPGYQIFGFTASGSPSWLSTDALHCRVKGIADIGMLYIKHLPLYGNQPAQDHFILNATLIPCSDSAVYNDSVLIWYSLNNGPYQVVHMTQTGGFNYTGIIPKQPAGSTIRYYLYAADKSGRHATAPFMGPADPFWFYSIYTDLTAIPDTLRFNTLDECWEGKVTTVQNYTPAGINLVNVDESGVPNIGGCMWYVDPVPVPGYPYLVNAGDSVQYRVKVTFPVNSPLMNYAVDTMNITSEIANHRVIIMVNDSLLTGIKSLGKENSAFLGNNYPNPVTGTTTISYNPGKNGLVLLEVFDVRGFKVRTLVNSVQPEGLHTVQWNGENDAGNRVPAGIYFYRMATDAGTVTKKLMTF